MKIIFIVSFQCYFELMNQNLVACEIGLLTKPFLSSAAVSPSMIDLPWTPLLLEIFWLLFPVLNQPMAKEKIGLPNWFKIDFLYNLLDSEFSSVLILEYIGWRV